MTRFMIHSHDTYGLGHVRRCSLIAEGLVGADADNEVLITTGSPRAMAFRLSERVDSLKLPAATKDATGAYQPRKLTCGIDRLVRLRSDVLLSAAGGYSPDVILVDHAPIGMAGELVPLLEHIDARAGRPRLVLGLRDIIDDPSRVEADWHRDGVWEWLDCYDEILVYGDRRVLTTAAELDLAARSSAIVTHTGFVAPTMPEPMATEPFVLVTAGGGGDGQALLRRYLDAVEAGATSGIRSVVVTGPLMSAGRRAELLVRADRLDSVEVIEFSDTMRSLIASASGVVSMAGYNTVMEELAAGVPALLVPRRRPRLEQQIRAHRLAKSGRLSHCPIERLTPARVARFVGECTRAPSPARTPLDLTGVATATAALCERSNHRRRREALSA